MDVTHPKVKYHWFISLTSDREQEQKKTVDVVKNLPKLIKISKTGLIFERPLAPEFLKLLHRGPSTVYLRILFKLQGHANWRSFDVKKLWPSSVDFSIWSSSRSDQLGAIESSKELFFNLDEDGSSDFNFTFDQSKF